LCQNAGTTSFMRKAQTFASLGFVITQTIAQENSVKDTSVEFTPAMLSEIVGELKEVLEYQPETNDKEQKKALRKKKKLLKELEGHRDNLMEYNNHLDTPGERNYYS
jgi:hypothetical protein